MTNTRETAFEALTVAREASQVVRDRLSAHCEVNMAGQPDAVRWAHRDVRRAMERELRDLVSVEDACHRAWSKAAYGR